MSVLPQEDKDGADRRQLTNRNTEVEQLEKELNVHMLYVWHRPDVYRKFLQKSIIVTPVSAEELQREAQPLADRIAEKKDLGHSYTTEVFPEKEFIQMQNSHKHWGDGAFVSIFRPLVVARRSPATGNIFYEDFEYCPETSKELEYVIAPDKS